MLVFLGMARQIVLLRVPSNLDLSATVRIVLQLWSDGLLLACSLFVFGCLLSP